MILLGTRIAQSLAAQSDFYAANDPSIMAGPETPYVVEVTMAGNAVYVEIDPADYMPDDDSWSAVEMATDHIGHDYAGYRESYVTDSGLVMVVFDRH